MVATDMCGKSPLQTSGYMGSRDNAHFYQFLLIFNILRFFTIITVVLFLLSLLTLLSLYYCCCCCCCCYFSLQFICLVNLSFFFNGSLFHRNCYIYYCCYYFILIDIIINSSIIMLNMIMCYPIYYSHCC